MKKVIFSEKSLRILVNEEVIRKQLINEVSGVSENVKILTDICIKEIELLYQEKKEEHQKEAKPNDSTLNYLKFKDNVVRTIKLDSDETLNKYPELKTVINSKIADKEAKKANITKQKRLENFKEGYPLNRSYLVLSILLVSTIDENEAMKELQQANASSQKLYDRNTNIPIGSQINARLVFLRGELLKWYAYDILSHELMHSYIKFDLYSRTENKFKTYDEIDYRKRRTYDKAQDVAISFNSNEKVENKQYDLEYIISNIFYLIRREETLSYSNGVYNSLNYYKEAIGQKETDYSSIFSMIRKTNGYSSLIELYCFANALNLFTDAQIYDVLKKNYKKELEYDIYKNNPQDENTNYQIRVRDFKKMVSIALRKTINQYFKVISYIYINLFNYNSTIMKQIMRDINNDLRNKYEKEYYPAFVSHTNTLAKN